MLITLGENIYIVFKNMRIQYVAVKESIIPSVKNHIIRNYDRNGNKVTIEEQ